MMIVQNYIAFLADIMVINECVPCNLIPSPRS